MDWIVYAESTGIRIAKPKLKHVKQIAIDEISIGKGHKYLTIVMDLKSGAVLHVGRGKGGDALTAFWRRLRASHAKRQGFIQLLEHAAELALAQLTEEIRIKDARMAQLDTSFDIMEAAELSVTTFCTFLRELSPPFTEEEYRRVCLWLDLNSPRLGAFNDVARQEQGELVWPDLDVDPDNITGIESPSYPRN